MRRALEWLEHHGIVFVLAGLISLGVLSLELHSETVSQKSLETAQLRSCHRLNVVQAEDNRSQYQDFGLFAATVRLLKDAITHPSQPTTAQQRAGARAYLNGVEQDILAKEWTPLLRCYQAINEPLRYMPPVPVPFAKMLPPASALRVGAGE